MMAVRPDGMAAGGTCQAQGLVAQPHASCTIVTPDRVLAVHAGEVTCAFMCLCCVCVCVCVCLCVCVCVCVCLCVCVQVDGVKSEGFRPPPRDIYPPPHLVNPHPQYMCIVTLYCKVHGGTNFLFSDMR